MYFSASHICVQQRRSNKLDVHAACQRSERSANIVFEIYTFCNRIPWYAHKVILIFVHLICQ